MSNQDQQQAEYQAYIAVKHAQMITPTEMVAEFVKRATGEGIAIQTRIMRGEANEVYNVKLTNGHEIIVRISHEEYTAFGKEKWAIEQCQKIGVPVPKVLLIENDLTDGKFRSICALEKLNGEPLMQRIRDNSITPEETASVIKETGNLLSKVHSIKTQKFGWLNESGVGHDNSWAEHILSRTETNKVARVKEVAKKINLDTQYIDQAVEILNQNQEVYSQVEPRLLHGDLGFEHIFIDGTQITGIIDWGNAASGDPLHDFAWWNFFHNDDETGLLLMEGYKNAQSSFSNEQLFGEDLALKLNLYKLYLSLDFLNYFDEGNFSTGLEIARTNLLKGLTYFISN